MFYSIRCSIKASFFKTFAKFTEKHLCLCLLEDSVFILWLCCTIGLNIVLFAHTHTHTHTQRKQKQQRLIFMVCKIEIYQSKIN